MPTNQSSIRFTAATRRQIEALEAAGWGSITNIVATAIDRMYKEEIKMPTVREIITANRQWVESHRDREIAAHLAAKPLPQLDGAIRDVAWAFRPGKVDFHLEHPTQLIAANPVGELLEAVYQAEQGRRGPLSIAEIEPVVAWLRANALPVLPVGS